MKMLPWISTYLQAWIDTPSVPLIKVKLEEMHATHIIKVNMRINTNNPRQKHIKQTCLSLTMSNQNNSSRY